MFGRKELIEMVGDMKTEVEAVRQEVALIVGTMKEYYEGVIEEQNSLNMQRMKVMEQRLARKIDEGIAPKVVEEISRSEQDKELNKNVENIKLKLSEVYALESKSTLMEDCGKRLTPEGERLYGLLSDVVLNISKLHGSKSLNRIANRTNYGIFSKGIAGIKTATKASGTTNGNRA